MECKTCGRSFSRIDSYQRHVRGHQHAKNFTCGKCSKAFKRKDNVKQHERNCISQQQPSGSGIVRQPRAATSKNFKIGTSQTAFANANVTWTLKYSKNDGPMDLIDAPTRAMKTHLDQCRQAHQALKFNMLLHANFEKAADPSIITIPPAVLVTEQFEVYADTDIEDLLREASKQLQNRIETYEGTGSGSGSGWIISNLVAVDTTVWQLDPLRASTYHP